MPHAFVQTSLSPQSFLPQLANISFRFEKIVVKTQPGFSGIDSRTALLPCLVIEPFRKQRFYIELRSKQDCIVVRLDPVSRVIRSVGVRLALACVVTHIQDVVPGSSISKGNLGSYFEFFEVEGDSARAAILGSLRKDLKPYLRNSVSLRGSSYFSLYLDAMKPPLKWTEIFLNDNPVEIEIGPGNGRFMLDKAATHPERNFLLIERSLRYLKILAQKIPRKNILNLRLLGGDARSILSQWVQPDSVTKFHIYFPDPWWKKKHKKHRLFSADFLNQLSIALCHRGRIIFVTDVKSLFDEVLELARGIEGLTMVEQKTYEPGLDSSPGRSNFEIKKWERGSPIYEATLEKGDK